MDFALFIVVTAILFIRPTEFVPGTEGFPLYLIAIVPCVVASWHRLVPQFGAGAMRERLPFALGIGMLLVGLFSDLAHGQFGVGFHSAIELAKVLIFYLLLVGHVDTPRRLELYLRCLVIIIAIPIGLAVLNWHGSISISAFKITMSGEDARFGATGNFEDPNDVCQILDVATLFSLCGLLDRIGPRRFIWLLPIALFAHAFRLTRSRGGLLGAAAGIFVLLRARIGGKKSVVLAGAAAALMLVVIGGRQSSISASEGTGQSRIQLWDAAFELFKASPLIGAGTGSVDEAAGHIAHNALIQAYAEWGFIGGTLLFAQYFWCLTNLWTLGPALRDSDEAEMRRVQPFILAALVSFATGEMTLTHPRDLVTYTMFGLATAFIRIAAPIRSATAPPPRRLFPRVLLYSAAAALALYIFTRLTVHYD